MLLIRVTIILLCLQTISAYSDNSSRHPPQRDVVPITGKRVCVGLDSGRGPTPTRGWGLRWRRGNESKFWYSYLKHASSPFLCIFLTSGYPCSRVPYCRVGYFPKIRLFYNKFFQPPHATISPIYHGLYENLFTLALWGGGAYLPPARISHEHVKWGWS